MTTLRPGWRNLAAVAIARWWNSRLLLRILQDACEGGAVACLDGLRMQRRATNESHGETPSCSDTSLQPAILPVARITG